MPSCPRHQHGSQANWSLLFRFEENKGRDNIIFMYTTGFFEVINHSGFASKIYAFVFLLQVPPSVAESWKEGVDFRGLVWKRYSRLWDEENEKSGPTPFHFRKCFWLCFFISYFFRCWLHSSESTGAIFGIFIMANVWIISYLHSTREHKLESIEMWSIFRACSVYSFQRVVNPRLQWLQTGKACLK